MSVLAVAVGALCGSMAALAARELLASAPGLAAWMRTTLEPLLRAGREGYVPSGLEDRRLGLLAGIAAAVLGWLLSGAILAACLAIAGPLLSRRLVVARRRRYRRRVERALPEVAGALADSVASGRSPRAALAELPESLDGAAATELTLLATELELGEPTAAAVDGLTARIDSPRLEAFAGALLAGRESGDDLAELMRRFAAGAEAHERALREARAATAQARFSGLLVVALPAGAALFAELLRPGFLAGLLDGPAPMAMVAIALVLQALGYVAIRRLGREEAG